jgi:hypothetical protein
VSPRRSEVGRGALSHRVDMEAMLPGWQPTNPCLYAHGTAT